MKIKRIQCVSGWIVLSAFLLSGCMSKIECRAKVEKRDTQIEFNYPSADPNIAKLLQKYRKKGSLSKLTKDHERYAINIISWQMEHGGFGLHDARLYEQPWDGYKERSIWVSKGRELGNFDDDATVAEIRFLAEVYNTTTDLKLKSSIKSSIAHGLQFILLLSMIPGVGHRFTLSDITQLILII